MNKIENKQIVSPAESCRNTESNPLRVALKVSSERSGIYHITKKAENNGEYFEYQGIKVPFRALIQDNNKTEGIVGISFGTARDCPSKKMGLCQVPEGVTCYAENGEARATRKNNEDGTKGMDSYYKGLLFSAFWDEMAINGSLRLAFIEWADSKCFDTFRVNLRGDFRHSNDVSMIYYLANAGFRFAVYTARDDLSDLLETLADHPAVTVNGSNRKYNNRFRVTTSIEEYLNASHRCLGSCRKCRNCYHLDGAEIICLAHGRGSERTLSDKFENGYFVAQQFNRLLGTRISVKDWQESTTLTAMVNNALDKIQDGGKRFKNVREIVDFLKEVGAK